MMNIGWYFNDELSPSDELVDKFADSKFGIDKWSSFAREIIQNSLDAQDNDNEPVEVIFDLNKELSLSDIPGGYRTKEILGYCMEAATNRQTKSSYKKGLEVLSREKVYCLKISDKNTKGVRTGRDEAWGAFVFDEGKSVKQRPGSAGSHGVGKKVPFIISSCNTVFYATKNKYDDNGVEKSDCLFQGKTTLISWRDVDGKRKNSKGWYGVINSNNSDPKNAILPINALNNNEINPYFLRKNEYGTDVIIVGANIYENELDVKGYIISAILENFFMAILNNKLIIDVFGEKISASTFNTMVARYYIEQSDVKNTLTDCLRVYNNESVCEKEVYDDLGNNIGKVKIYFGLGNEHNKKYYTIVRSHGMRITDYRVNKASQPYTAVVIVEGLELNNLLSSLENAAHDKFVTKDENMEIDRKAVYAVESIKKIVSDYIIEQTKIDATKGQEIDSLNNIITIPGIVASVKKKNSPPTIKRNSVKYKGKGSKSKNNKERKTGESTGKKKKTNSDRKNKSAKKNGKLESILYNDFKLEPFFMKKDDGYDLKLAVLDDIRKADICIHSINSEEKQDNTIGDYIESVSINGTRRKCIDGKIVNIPLSKDKEYNISIRLKKNITYQLSAEVFVKEGEIDE